jgi:hypothetical protein
MAADLVANPRINHTFVHDLESAYYVVFWLSIRFLPNSWTPQKRAIVMHELFNPLAFSDEGASSKQVWMATSSPTHTMTFEVVGNPLLTGLIRSLNQHFHARHEYIVNQDKAAAAAAATTTVPIFGPRVPTSSVDEAPIKDFLRFLDTHEGVIGIFTASLLHGWPEDEPAMKQYIAHTEREGLYSSSKSKRSKSYYGKDVGKEGSSQKRLRTE